MPRWPPFVSRRLLNLIRSITRRPQRIFAKLDRPFLDHLTEAAPHNQLKRYPVPSPDVTPLSAEETAAVSLVGLCLTHTLFPSPDVHLRLASLTSRDRRVSSEPLLGSSRLPHR